MFFFDEDRKFMKNTADSIRFVEKALEIQTQLILDLTEIIKEMKEHSPQVFKNDDKSKKVKK